LGDVHGLPRRGQRRRRLWEELEEEEEEAHSWRFEAQPCGLEFDV